MLSLSIVPRKAALRATQSTRHRELRVDIGQIFQDVRIVTRNLDMAPKAFFF
jgi:hypothetical protein